MGKRVILAVTNDLVGDQRVHKVALSLLKAGHEPVLAGRRLPFSGPLERPYRWIRFRLPFRDGPLFYASYNLRLFLYLVSTKADIFLANDLDTLPAVYLAGRLRGKRVVYDSHEYFTQVPELVNRALIRRIWERTEAWIFPRLKTAYTVNQTIARIYHEKYRIEVKSFLNLPPDSRPEAVSGHLPECFEGYPVILYQGAVNVGRGIAEMIRAMALLPEFRLLIVGDGDVRENLEILAHDLGISGRVHFTGRIPFQGLTWYTAKATLGISLEQDIGLNYRFSLPNKLFDYMHSGLPVIASDLPEIGALVREVNFGILIDRFDPEFLAQTIKSVLNDPGQMARWKANALSAAPHYTWESQEEELVTTIIGS